MLHAEYKRLRKQVAAKARQHQSRTSAVRRKLAQAIIRNPSEALAAAHQTLANKKAPQLQWSKRAWTEILRSKSPSEIASLLMQPSAEQQTLADSHPFGGLLVVARNGH